MKLSSETVSSFAAALGLVYAGVLFACGASLTGEAKEIVGYLPTVLGLLTWVFDKWAWRTRPILWAVGRPFIAGTWQAVLRPRKESHIPGGGNRGPIEASVIIEQTYFSVHVVLYTAESGSRSTTAAIKSAGESENRTTLSYVYSNQPKLEHQHRSMAHAGSVELEIPATRPTALSGSYWTNRLTAGDMQLTLLMRRSDFGSHAEVTKAMSEKSRLQRDRARRWWRVSDFLRRLLLRDRR